MHNVFDFIKFLTFRKLFNLSLIGLNYLTLRFFKTEYFRTFSISLTIEPTNLCNLRCPQCSTGLNLVNGQKGYMTFENFRQLIERFGKHLFMIQLHFRGEPMLHKQLFDFISLAKYHNIYTSLYTNGQFILNNDKNLLKSGLDHINISLDGTTNETYTKYRIGGNLKKLMDGIQQLTETKIKGGCKKPRITLQMLVSKHNGHQIEDFKKLKKKIKGIDSCLLKTMQIIDKSTEREFLEKKFWRWAKPKFLCTKTLTTAVITWQGNMVPCCYDREEKYKTVIDLTGDTKNILHVLSSRQHLFRINLAKGSLKPKMCMNCEMVYKKIYY